MQNANLSYSLLQRVLISLEKQGLVKKTECMLKVRSRDRRTTRVYELTTKGEQVLRYLRNVDSVIQVGSNKLGSYPKLRNSNTDIFLSK
jgi:predicted transcriptional regulator